MSRVSLQSPLLQAALRRPTAQLIPRCLPAPTKATAARTFSHLPTLRPTLTAPSPIFRPPGNTTTTTTTMTSMTSMTSTPTGEVPDVLAKTSITSHPALAGCASQIRCGPRATMAFATRLIQKRRNGFLSRIRTHKGRNVLKRRKAKGRKKLAHG